MSIDPQLRASCIERLDAFDPDLLGDTVRRSLAEWLEVLSEPDLRVVAGMMQIAFDAKDTSVGGTMLSLIEFWYPVVRVGPLMVQLEPEPQSAWLQHGSTHVPLKHATSPARHSDVAEQLCPVVRVPVRFESSRQ